MTFSDLYAAVIAMQRASATRTGPPDGTIDELVGCYGVNYPAVYTMARCCGYLFSEQCRGGDLPIGFVHDFTEVGIQVDP
jgi:hypothetical protein